MPTLDHDAIAKRIPHHGRMCLLDKVLEWDLEHIRCEAGNHSQPDHPLRAHGRLGAACGVEYAAQAMAVHGALVAESGAGNPGAGAPRVGYLASVRGLTLHVDRLDRIAGPLDIRVERMTGDDSTVLYSFSVEGDAKTLLSGRAVVVLDAAVLPAGPLGASR